MYIVANLHVVRQRSGLCEHHARPPAPEAVPESHEDFLADDEVARASGLQALLVLRRTSFGNFAAEVGSKSIEKCRKTSPLKQLSWRSAGGRVRCRPVLEQEL